MTTRAEAVRLREGGLSYTDIEALLGMGDRRGFAARALILGIERKKSNRPPRPPSWTEGPVAEFSLWKAADGGRSFAKIKAALAFAGIPCERVKYPTDDDGGTTTVSPWEARYEIQVPAHREDEARALLFVELATGQEPQALDDISDPTR